MSAALRREAHAADGRAHQFLLLFALHVDAAAAVGIAEEAGDGGACDEGRDLATSFLHPVERCTQPLQMRVLLAKRFHVLHERDLGVRVNLWADDVDGRFDVRVEVRELVVGCGLVSLQLH
eukprot:3633509-Rhodomonas_salina.2